MAKTQPRSSTSHVSRSPMGRALGWTSRSASSRWSWAGRPIVPPGEALKARLDVSRPSNGYAIRLRFPLRVEGPCMRCLEAAARRDRGRRPRGRPGRHRRRGAAQPLRRRRRARPGPLGPRRRRPGDARAHPLPPRLRRPLPGLRRVPQRRRPRGARARRRRRPALGQAARARSWSSSTRPRGVGCPERAASCFSPRHARGRPQTPRRKTRKRRGPPALPRPPATMPASWPSRRRELPAPAATSGAPPQGRQGAAEQVPALPQPAAAAPGLPDLRHLQGS